jgi:hypothetical protein
MEIDSMDYRFTATLIILIVINGFIWWTNPMNKFIKR